MEFTALVALVLALLPLLLGLWNLHLYRPPALPADLPPGTRVSVLIPARDEEANIAACVGSVLANGGVELEVVVLDDASQDRTAEIVGNLARADDRVRLERAPPLPPGWCGKQHACHVLAERARYPILLFVDADVRLSPDAVATAAGVLLGRDIGLASGFPRQITRTAGERLMIPLIHLLLLGYLPMVLMRRRLDEGLGAGCGQFIIAHKEAYQAAGGHAAIRHSLHDGVTLPRAFRRAGAMTDLFDATRLAGCRMYGGSRALWQGFSKNATEGMATPRALPVWSVLLFGGHVLAWLLLPLAVATGASMAAIVLSALAIAANLALRAVMARRFEQSWSAIVLHPASIMALLVLQWRALAAARSGRDATWRGRSYPAP